jgi:spore coat protein H
VKVGVADNWRDPSNEPLKDVTRYTEEYGLPVFHLAGGTELDPDTYSPVSITYRGHTYTAQAKLRGSSSLSFPKNSYTMKFAAEDPFNEPALGGGFTERRSLVLVNTFNDNSYLRSRLGFELWSRLSPEAIPVRTFSVVVFLDGAYYGLYTVVDHVNARHMKANGLSEEGNLYKAETGGANFRLVDQFGRPKPHLHVGFEKKDGQPPGG